MDWTEEDPGSCPYCNEPWELVRPGKSQPVCECQDYCPEHGVKFQYRSSFGDAGSGGIYGWLCPICYPEGER